jgi:hypothetical protein
MAGYQLYLSKEACNPLVSRKLIDEETSICPLWTALIDRTLLERYYGSLRTGSLLRHRNLPCFEEVVLAIVIGIEKSETTLQGQIVDKLKLKAMLLCLLVHGGACLDPEEPGTTSPTPAYDPNVANRFRTTSITRLV